MHCKFDPYTIEFVDAAFQKTNWEGLKERISQPNYRWTVIHGDAHAGNFVWDTKTKSLVIVDFETVGLGNPMTDITTFLLLRSKPAWRRKYEHELV